MKQEDPYLDGLRVRIRNCEERFISYKKMLEGVHRDKDVFPPGESWVIEHKDNLREGKNMEQQHLAELIEEKTYYPGMTPTQFARMGESIRKANEIRDTPKSLAACLTKIMRHDEFKHLHEDARNLLDKLPEM